MKLKQKHPEYIFFYGSLRRSAKHDVFEQVKENLLYVGSGYFSGLLYDLGEYPGVIATGETSVKVKGEIYAVTEKRNEVFRLLDEYEGYDREKIKKSLFVRKRATIRMRNGSEIRGWVYLYNRPERIKKAKVITSGDYLRFKKIA